MFPADEVTLDRPCEAFDVYSEAFSFAVSVVEALRTKGRRRSNRGWRKTARDAGRDIVCAKEEEMRGGG